MSRLRRHAVPVVACLGIVDAFAIVNGTTVSDERFAAEYPWAVALEYPGSDQVCTATLIHPSWVLTAAHCTSSDVRVKLAHASRSRAVAAAVAAVHVHPRYDATTGAFDIGLIELARPATRPTLAVAQPGEIDRLLQSGAPALIAGWGRRSASSGYSDRLVASDLRLDRLEREESRFAYLDTASGPCGGDSGGPLLLAASDGTRRLVGIASRVAGDPCAAGGGIGIYADVGAALPFLRAHVPGLSGSL
jgi:secreted trypsin-like serine protease